MLKLLTLSTPRDSRRAACNGNRSKFQLAKFCEANYSSVHFAAVPVADGITHPFSCPVSPETMLPRIKAQENATVQRSVVNRVASALTLTPPGRLFAEQHSLVAQLTLDR